MTLEEMQTALYEKVNAEQQKYRDWLLAQPPLEVLNHSYEYAMREDIVCSLEFLELSEKQCKVLLKSPSPLSDVFKTYQKQETNHMNNICDAIESRANELIRRDFLRKQQEAGR